MGDTKAYTPKPGEEGLTKREIMLRRMEAAMKLNPEMKITLGDGKEYTLVMDNRAAKGVIADTGINLLSEGFTGKDFENPDVLGAVLFRCLRKFHPELTQEQVDELMPLRHVIYIRARLTDAVSLFFPDMDDLPDEGQAKEGESESDPT